MRMLLAKNNGHIAAELARCDTTQNIGNEKTRHMARA
jgi:hypothetical protein